MNQDRETTLRVRGMSCPSCVGGIEDRLLEIQGVRSVDVRLREGRVVVRHRAEVEPAALATAVTGAGYEVEGVAA